MIVLALLPLRDDVSQAVPALLLVLPGIVAARFGGRVAAAVVAALSSVAYGVLFLPPFGEWKIVGAEDVAAASVFVLVALAVGDLTARDAERRRLAEARADELENLHANLEAAQAVQEDMAQELGHMGVLAEVDKQRSALLRSVSHDLRTPLATIRAVSSDLLGDTPYDSETQAELLELVSDEAERLDRLVANLLSMSRIEAGAFAPDRQALVLAELAANSAQRLSRVLKDRRVEIEVPPDLPFLDADYTQLDLVVTNLLENAARHSFSRSTIRVGARAHVDHVEIWVENRGENVLPIERDRIFEAFHRSHGSRSSGIGLAICKAIVEAHGGSIGVSGAAGGGARFVFTIPVNTSSSISDVSVAKQREHG